MSTDRRDPDVAIDSGSHINASLQRLILRKIVEAEAVQMKGRGSLLCSRT
jgi:hypothetical protein